MTDETTDSNEKTATVSEDKFNGTATLEVSVPEGSEKRMVKAFARKFFRETHGTDPSKVIAEKERNAPMIEGDKWTVMVSDHSSGSMVNAEEYEL